MSKIKEFIKKNKVLILLIILALLLRFPWLYTTMEKDEGIFGYSAWRLLSGDGYAKIRDDKPPLLYMLYAIPIYFFGNSIIPVRIFNNVLFVTSVIFFFQLTRHFFPKKNCIVLNIVLHTFYEHTSI